MAKKSVFIFLFSVIIMLFASAPCFADEETNDARGDFFIKNIIINGEKIINYNLQYAVLLYEDTMYIPLTPEMCEIYGMKPAMDWENNTLVLSKAGPTKKNISSADLKNNVESLHLNIIEGAKAIALSQSEPDCVYDRAEEITEPFVIQEEIDLKGLPLLETEGNIYIPLRAVADTGLFNWNIYFSNYYGVCISTDSSIPGKTYLDSREALENKGLVNYIMRYNSTIVPSYGQQLVFLFKRAGEVYGVDPKLLMAIAQRESKFNTGAVGRGGALGMMQVMPATGARYELTPEELMDPKTAIDFTAMYMSERIAAYGGDLVLALSAYNQGSVKVNRGKYSSVYANNVLSTYSGIESYLEVNGYII